MKKSRVAIMISGNGSNMEALIKVSAAEDFPAEIVGVLSDKAQADGLMKAQRLGVATFVCEREHFASRGEYEAKQLDILTRLNPDIICLAGYMRLMSPEMVEAWAGRMLNIHPSLLPLFPGLDTHRRALEAGVKIVGCTVHLVTPVMDGGPILAQAAVPVMDGDDEVSLKARLLAAEHQLYVNALRHFIMKSRSDGGREHFPKTALHVSDKKCAGNDERTQCIESNEAKTTPELFSYGQYATNNRR